MILLTLFVNDSLCSTYDHALYYLFVKDLSEKFELGEAGQLKWYLGVSVKQDIQRGVTKLSQLQYVLDVLTLFGVDSCKPTSTQLQPNVRLSKDGCPDFETVDKAFGKQYQQIVGALQYLASWTHGELAHPVGELSRFLSNPGQTHMEQAKHVLHYLTGSLKEVSTYH